MELQLRYTASSASTAAVVLHGSTPQEWLQELNRWNCSGWHLECYILPRSLRNPEACGLLVLPSDKIRIPSEGSFSCYQKIASGLFIPVEASLYPSCTKEELDKILIWDLHVFHPSIGFIGFDKAERLYLSDLMEPVLPSTENWACADFGIPTRDRLERIHVESLSTEEMMDSFKELMDKKSLEDILSDDEREESKNSALDKVKEGIFRGFLSASEKIRNSLPESTDGTDGPISEMLGKFGSWMNRNLGDIEKRRNAELEKLLKMFDNNIEEALKYAIPLDSNYINRGKTDIPSDSLGKHSTNFSLKGLGGGGSADYWNVDKYYNDLRTKYLKAAQEEIRNGNFEKAAYIYAHLLHDFHSAANVLIQGKFFREAAVLYKEHLKDIPAAANCLESGGLYEEAIRIYIDLNRYEKVGDLYTLLLRKEKADEYYEKAVDTYLSNHDCIEASRIYRTKLFNQEKEKEVLLQGWDIHQSEACLKMYFTRIQEIHPEEITSAIKNIYQKCTLHKQQGFLQVLYNLRQSSHDEDLNHTMREIAYEILSTAFKQGNKRDVHMLKTFVEGDKLVHGDGLRFKPDVKTKAELAPYGDIRIQLDNSVRWLNAIVHGNQFLALGIKEQNLRMVRGNWYGNLEYYSWTVEVSNEDSFSLMKDNFFGNRIIMNSSTELPFEERVLPKNKYFNQELRVQGPGWKQQDIVAIQNRHMGCSLLKTNGSSLTLHSFDSRYNLIKSEPIVGNDIPVAWPETGPSQVVEGTNCSYAFLNATLIAFNEYRISDPVNSCNFPGYIHMVKGMRTANGTVLVVTTENETWLLNAEEKNFGTPQKICNFSAIDILFISAEKIILADKYEARLFVFKGTDAPEQYKYDSKLPLVALLPTPDRKRFAMLDITGSVNSCIV